MRDKASKSLEFEISGSLKKVKSNGAVGLPIYDLLLVSYNFLYTSPFTNYMKVWKSE